MKNQPLSFRCESIAAGFFYVIRILILDIKDRQAFRAWLSENSAVEGECWLSLKRGRPTDDGALSYLDAVEEALCFGWIDSTQKVIGGVRLQRFSPRQKKQKQPLTAKEGVVHD